MKKTPLWLHRYAVITAAATFFLLFAGGMVTSTDSGLAVPDWPLSYGMLFPPMVGGIFYEHGHRMGAGVVGLMLLGLAIALGRCEPRRWVRRLGFGALGGVILQALLGGLTVLLLLPPQVSIAHACLGQGVFCLVAGLAWCTHPKWESERFSGNKREAKLLARLGVGVALTSMFQLFLGAIVRHTGHGHMLLLHAVNAPLMLGLCLWLLGRLWKLRNTTTAQWLFAVRLMSLLGIQVALGIGVWLNRSMTLLRTAHVAIGALILSQAVILGWALLRRTPHGDALKCMSASEPAACGRSPSGVTRCQATFRRSMGPCFELMKPRVSFMVVMTTGVGYWLGTRSPNPLPGLLLACFSTALVVAGANVLNQWFERDSDALMARTRRRPLPSGRIDPTSAYRVGVGLSVAGILMLGIFTNVLSALLAFISWASYVLVYTPMKRMTPLCTLVGAVPGALPPVIGWAAARNELGSAAWALFAILFVWQLPHFLALAVLYREDYSRAGLPMLPSVSAGAAMTGRQTVFSAFALLPISLFPSFIGLAGTSYFYGAALLGLGFAAIAAHAASLQSLQNARRLFQASVIYLPVLLVLLACDRILI